MAQPPFANQQCPTCAGPVAPGRTQCEFCGTPITPYGGAAFGGGGGGAPYGGGPPIAPFGSQQGLNYYNPPARRSGAVIAIVTMVAVVTMFGVMGAVFAARARRAPTYQPSYTVDTATIAEPTPTITPMGTTVATNPTIAMFDPKCTAGDAQACIVLGSVYRNGQQVPVDEAKARAYFTRACSLGDKSGCILRDMKVVHH